MDASFSEHLNFNFVEDLPGFNARAAFTINSQSVFKEDVDIVPTIVDDRLSYMPWGGDNQMPFDILSLVEKDETLATCQIFNAEASSDSCLQYDTCNASASFLTTTCRLTFSESVRTSCNFSSSCQCLFSMKTVRKLYDF